MIVRDSFKLFKPTNSQKVEFNLRFNYGNHLLVKHHSERSSIYLQIYINLVSYGLNPQLGISKNAGAQ